MLVAGKAPAPSNKPESPPHPLNRELYPRQLTSRNTPKPFRINRGSITTRDRSRPVNCRQIFAPLTHGLLFLALVGTLLLSTASLARADRPYAPSRDYALQNVRTHLWFDLKHRAIRGEVTETVSTLRDNVSELSFDSTGLDISAVTLDGAPAHFTVTSDHLAVSLAHPASRGDRHEVFIRYSGEPKRGIFFILPDKNYPQQPAEIWTQGEAEDTHAYIPIYDYPNDRTTSEMLLTVPASWTTVSNGQLLGVQTDAGGTKTWDWKQSQPLSTYLISAIAGDFVEHDDTWHGVRLRYLVPRGHQADIEPTFVRTKAMLDLFTSKLGVPYPWPQYAQTSVDDFTEGGMENTSATTLSTSDLVDPLLAPEYRVGADDVNSHELSHQWFGDLVTCKDWANLWLNEGFATFFENFWLEHKNGPDAAAYEYWQQQNRWFREKRLFGVPILTRDFTDSTQYDGNTYQKAGWVLRMLREKLGDDEFFGALRHYLEVNRGQNVVTADLQKAIEQSTSTDVDRFFHQWIYRAGAPEFDVAYSYDSSAREVKLDVKQTQKLEGLVELFDVPIDVEIVTPSGRKTYSVEIDKSEQALTFPSDAAPLMVLFDPGDKILKKVDFEKTPEMLIYQLKNAEAVPDRADAAVALADVRNNPDVISALGDATLHDPFWGVRVESLRALAKLGGPDAEKPVLSATSDAAPWVREAAAEQLARFAPDSAVAPKLVAMATSDSAYLVRAAALRALAQSRSVFAFDVLASAAKTDSPDDVIRRAALVGFGMLGDSRAVPLLLDWSAPGKPFACRESAISSLAALDRSDGKITETLVSYLHEPYFDLQVATILALARRGDPSAAAPLRAMLHGRELTTVEEPYIQTALNVLQSKGPAE